MTEPSLWDFLERLPLSFQAQLFYGMFMAGSLGMGMNWLVKWLRDEVPCFMTYMFRTNVKQSILAVLMLASTLLTAISTEVFFADGKFVGWFNVLWTGAATGFAVDATINKGERQKWTPEARERARLSKTV